MPKGTGHPPPLGRSLLVLAGFLAVCLGIALLSSAVTVPAVETWYRTIEKPFFTPPDVVFGPVWTALYVLIAVAGWRIWVWAGFGRGARALSVYAIQLLLNFAWSFLFFGMHAPGLGLIDIVLLLGAIGWTIHEFMPIDQVGAYLLTPYLAWVGFAAILNATIFFMN